MMTIALLRLLKRLYHMVEDGSAEMNDPLRERIATLRLDPERA